MGESCKTGGKPIKDVTGYDLNGLFTGSEGTLGIITEALLRLIARPRYAQTALAEFASLDDASRTVNAILSAGIVPASLELMDQTAIICIEEAMHLGLNTTVEASLIIETDGADEQTVLRDIEAAAAICRETGASSVKLAQNEAERSSLWKARRSMSPSLARKAPNKLGEDITVPRAAIPEVVRRLRAISAKYGLPIVIFGHAGDGNLHPEHPVRQAPAGAVGHGREDGGGGIRGLARRGRNALRRAWSRRAQASLSGARAWTGVHGRSAAHQAGARPVEHPEPGENVHHRKSIGELNMAEQNVHVPVDKLVAFMVAALEKMGVPNDDAKIIADVLITSDLWGVRSHGVAHLKMYHERMKKGLQLPVDQVEGGQGFPGHGGDRWRQRHGHGGGLSRDEAGHREGAPIRVGRGRRAQLQPLWRGRLLSLDGGQGRPGGNERDQCTPLHRPDVWRQAHAGHQPDRGRCSNRRTFPLHVSMRPPRLSRAARSKSLPAPTSPSPKDG